MASEEIKRYRVIISGRVQGVAFRYYTVEMAGRLGITGWVRNVYPRDVEAVVEGKSPEIGKMIAFLRQGPPAAHVMDIHIVEEPYAPGEFSDFSIRF